MTHFPEAFLSMMRALLGDEYAAFYEALSQEPQRGLRLNPTRAWQSPGDAVPWEPHGRYAATDAPRPGQDPAHFAGAYYMQEPSAMAPARALDVVPGELVLDLCAAPGGKSGQLGAALMGMGALVSNEPDAQRAKALSGNLERLGIANALVVSAMPDVLAKLWPGRFDAILVDAPCSGEGMFRRDAASRTQWSEDSPAGCARRQAQILRAAAAMLRPGGRMVYSTCTFNTIENEGTIRGFLSENAEFTPRDFSLPGIGASQDGMLRLWPHRVRGEGHFVAMLKKSESAVVAPAAARAQRPSRRMVDADAPDAAFAALVREIPGDWPAKLDNMTLCLRGETLCALPSVLPDASGLSVLRAGLHLCQVGTHIKPDHALAMALSPQTVLRALPLCRADILRFLRGEALTCDDALRGWTLVTHNDLPLGWGKAVQGTLKNHVPKGLRLH